MNALQAVVTALDTNYASRTTDTCDDECFEFLRDLGLFIESNNFMGYGVSGRARAIITVAGRILAGGALVEDTDIEKTNALNMPEHSL